MYYMHTKENQIAITIWWNVFSRMQREEVSKAFLGSPDDQAQIDVSVNTLAGRLYHGLKHNGKHISPTRIAEAIRILAINYPREKVENENEGVEHELTIDVRRNRIR